MFKNVKSEMTINCKSRVLNQMFTPFYPQLFDRLYIFSLSNKKQIINKNIIACFFHKFKQSLHAKSVIEKKNHQAVCLILKMFDLQVGT